MLELVEDVKLIQRSWDQLQRAMRQGARRKTRSLGSRKGAGEHNLVIREDLGIWMAPGGEIRGRRYCPFGVLPLPDRGNVSMVVQLNPALEATATGTGGCLARDDADELWFCHTGRIGGGREGINRSAFLAWTDRPLAEVLRDGRPSIEVFPLARVGSPEVLPEIADFVREVHAFKSKLARPTAKARKARGPFREDESIHRIEARAGYEAHRFHGVVCNRLVHLLAKAGHKVNNDRFRDITIGRGERPDIEFEIKPSHSWQHLYTAVGQLMLHSTRSPAKTKVLVVPAGMPREKREAIYALGVRLVEYRTTKQTLVFEGLDAFLDVPTTSVPLRTTTAASRNGKR